MDGYYLSSRQTPIKASGNVVFHVNTSNAPSMIFKGRMTGTGIDWATREDRKIKSKEMPGVILR